MNPYIKSSPNSSSIYIGSQNQECFQQQQQSVRIQNAPLVNSTINRPLPVLYNDTETNLLMGNVQFFDLNSNLADHSNNFPNRNSEIPRGSNSGLQLVKKNNYYPCISIRKINNRSVHTRNVAELKPSNRISKPQRKMNTSTWNLLKYVDPEYRRRVDNENVNPQLNEDES